MILKKLQTKYSEDVVEALTLIGNSNDDSSEEYNNASKLLETKINNLDDDVKILEIKSVPCFIRP